MRVLQGMVIGGSLLLHPMTDLAAQEHLHDDGGGHGEVNFPVNCMPAVQTAFNRAVALLHSYGYEEARRGFLQIAEQDPSCGMAWWGVAMTYYHTTWPQPFPSVAAGRNAAQKAREVGAGTARETAYIDAVAALYAAEAAAPRDRAVAYSQAMERLASRFPEDVEASLFYGVSLLGAALPGDTSYTYQKRAANILNRLATEHPRHPGILHYTIHAFDYPKLAKLALPAAQAYAGVAPEVPHALHMPSHIFTRLGLWAESIESNRQTARAAKLLMARTHPGATAFEDLHARDYLAYAYLQLGRDAEAREIVQSVSSLTRFDEPNLIVAHALVAIPARFAVERRDWPAAAALKPPAAELPWERFPFVRAITRYANAIGAARAGNIEQARHAVTDLKHLQATVAANPPGGAYDWAGRVESMRLVAEAWLAHAEREGLRAVRLLTAAANLEEKVGKHAVTPGPILPAREQLGDLLRELRQPIEALAAYEAALVDSPRRLNGLAGAAMAAESAGEHERARRYYQELRTLCRAPACERPIADRAERFADSE